MRWGFRCVVGQIGLNHHLGHNEARSRWLWVRLAMCGGSDRPFSPPPIPTSPPPPPKRRRSSSNRSDRSFHLGLVGFCWGLSYGSCCLSLETMRVDLDFEWSCCLGLKTERVVLVRNEWENSGSSMKEWEMIICFFFSLVFLWWVWVLGCWVWFGKNKL